MLTEDNSSLNNIKDARELAGVFSYIYSPSLLAFVFSFTTPIIDIVKIARILEDISRFNIL